MKTQLQKLMRRVNYHNLFTQFINIQSIIIIY